MPNHFLVVGLCANPENKELHEFHELEDKDLCAEVLPRPDELNNIVSTSPPCRYRNKQTGEIWKDANGPSHDFESYERVSLTLEEIEALQAKHGAATWYEWCNKHWGTKWGTYSLKLHEMGGDGSPILIEFQTAWRPPNERIMRLITDYLAGFGLVNITWIGHNPRDSQTMPIEVEL